MKKWTKIPNIVPDLESFLRLHLCFEISTLRLYKFTDRRNFEVHTVSTVVLSRLVHSFTSGSPYACMAVKTQAIKIGKP